MGSCLISFISVLISLLIPISIFVSISILMADMPYGNWKMFLRDSSAVNIDPLLTNSTVYHLTIVTFCKPKQRINPDPVESGSFSGSGVFCFRSGSDKNEKTNQFSKLYFFVCNSIHRLYILDLL